MLVMRDIIKYGNLVALLFLSTHVFGQKTATAVMNVTATIVSGSTLSEITDMDINFEEKSVTAGGFELLTAKTQETQIENAALVTLQNEYGDEITIIPNSQSKETDGLQNVRILADIDEINPAMRGTYTGILTTTISYF